jgi:adenosine deaminase
MYEFECIKIKNCPAEYKEKYEKIAKSLSRYVKYVFCGGENDQADNKILLVPLVEKIWKNNNFHLTEEMNDNSGCKFAKNIKGILFFTTEELARGDSAESFLNRSRMVRSFFERTTHAKTANHMDIFIKIRELICDKESENLQPIKKKSPNDAYEDLKKLKDESCKIINCNYQYLLSTQQQSKKKFCDSLWKEMQKLYTYRSFHTHGTHGTMRNLDEYIRNDNEQEYFKVSKEFKLSELLYDLAFTVAWNPLRINSEEDSVKILVIDDNLANLANSSSEKTLNDFQNLRKLLPTKSEVKITCNKEECEKLVKDDFLKKNGPEINVKEINKTGLKKRETKKLIENNKFYFTHVIVDLLIGNYNEGNKIIRNLLRLRHKLGKEGSDSKFDIIACSLSEEIEDIHRSLQEGAISFVPKKRIFLLPGIISRLEEGRQSLPGGKSMLSKYRNFGKLYQLPERIKRKLHTEPFAQFSDDSKIANQLSKDLALNWIKKVPKAELHYHIGGSMNADIVFNLALNNLRHKREKNSNNFKKFSDESIKVMIPLIEQLGSEQNKNKEHLVFSEHKRQFKNIVFEEINSKSGKGNSSKSNNEENNKTFFDVCPKRIKKDFFQEVQNWKTDQNTEITEKENEGKWKKLFLITEFIPINEPSKWEKEISEKNDEDLIFKYFTWRIQENLKKQKHKIKPSEIDEEDVISLFIVLVGIFEGKSLEDVMKFWKLPDEVDENFTHQYINPTDHCLLKTHEIISNKINKYKIELNNTLYNLISSENRRGNLKNYLRGSTFCGSLHLQYYENIFACVAHLVEEAADDSIRYLEIRVSPEGYMKKDLTTQEAIEALFDGADFMSHYLYNKKEKFIWVNFIITAKRHKTPEKMAIEISSAITNRERTVRKKENLKEIQKGLPKNCLTAFGYEWQPSRIAGVDLAGLEEGFKPAQYEEDFSSLFKTCSFITIHAGEEGSAQNVWEAVYKLNAQRIGHGLTLIKHPFLLELAKNTQLCLEMAPISNIFTNPNLENNYPFYDYIKKSICVTINTDDKAWSGSSLSDEYVKSAELYWKRAKNKNLKDEFLTKWEVLRIVKNGFKKAFIDRKEVRELLKAVEEEIYQLMLEEERIEKIRQSRTI